MTKPPLLSVSNLSIAFPTDEGQAFAVRDVSFALDTQECLGIVGESGCGKSLTSLAILGLIPKPGQLKAGNIQFNGQTISKFSQKEMQKIRGKEIALIPQDPMTSLNPVYTIGNQLIEVLEQHQGLFGHAAKQKAAELLDLVKLPNAKNRLDDYPHQFSGGMRQRVMIAMAISCQPKLLIADEPTTALDVTVQAQILALLKELQQELKTAIILITHDLGVVAEICQRVSVMYAGRLVETASVHDLFKAPKHPYTVGLLQSLPKPGVTKLQAISGQPPALTEIPQGCAFEPRCDKRFNGCESILPDMIKISSTHHARCLLYQDTVA